MYLSRMLYFRTIFSKKLLARELANIVVSLLITEMGQEVLQFWSGMVCIIALMQAFQEHQMML